MIYAFLVISAAILILSLPVRAYYSVRIRLTGAYLVLRPKLFFGLLPVTVRMSAVLRYGTGIAVFSPTGKMKTASAKKRKKRKFPIKAVRFLSINASGAVGINDAPDKSVLSAGALAQLVTAAALLVNGVRPEVFIEPYFDRSAFALNVEGILEAVPGKIIIEAIKLEKENRK